MAEKLDLTRALGEPVPREEIINIIKEDVDAYEQYLSFPENLNVEALPDILQYHSFLPRYNHKHLYV